jgi:hypothetical protein
LEVEIMLLPALGSWPTWCIGQMETFMQAGSPSRALYFPFIGFDIVVDVDFMNYILIIHLIQNFKSSIYFIMINFITKEN